jgi:hypothetical protein
MFNHGFGLGVLRKPGGDAPTQPLLQYLFEPDPAQKSALRAFYVHASKFMEYKRKASRVGQGAKKGGQGKPDSSPPAPGTPTGQPQS